MAYSALATTIIPYRLSLRDPEVGGEGYLQPAADISYTTRPGYRGHWNGDHCGGCSSGQGLITIDAYGFRTDPSRRTSLSAVDVMCMGDSFTFGYLVDDLETYPRDLELLYGPSKVVVNAGYYGGFSFDSAELRYRNDFVAHPRKSFAQAPKVLVYGVFPLNDFSDLGVWMNTDASGRPAVIRSDAQVLNEIGYSMPLLRESRLFVGLTGLWSQWAYRDMLGETARLRSQRIADVIRRFHEEVTATGTRLVFVILREPNGRFENHLAEAAKLPVEDYRKKNEALVDQLKEALDANDIEWHDDAALIDQLHAGLVHHRLPEIPGKLPVPLESLQKRAASSDWNPSVLAAADGVHYSGLTNAYVASWIHERLVGNEFETAAVRAKRRSG